MIPRDGDQGRWLWSPCSSCGGTVLPLRDPAGVSDLAPLCPSVHGVLAGLLGPIIDDHHCPGCETRRRRTAPSGAEPAVWYDTLLCDWVVALPSLDGTDGTLLPLEIHWFDADWADVYRAAADIAYCDDALTELS
jgi:hypothetical protein